MLGPFRHCHHVKHLNHAAVALTNTSLGEVISGLATRKYSDDKKGQGCCKDVVQTAGMKVEPWPKPDDSPQPWRVQCPQEPQPPNYDPYRIKVPETVVPPLPPSNAKEIPNEDSTELFKNPAFYLKSGSKVQDLFYNSPIVHPDYWKDKPSKKLAEVVKDVLPNLGYHGKIKYKYAFHEPWKPLDRMALLQEAEKEEEELIEHTTRAVKAET
ncbi:hypothetical protein PYW08_006567 [Mythimna loreyi]|uniref:Uncharacterized protein n=1 Tax=Mythimna loreyi TaxID=667449 RepID=A0ACC2QQI7_9NEOP|nr:hypothetical protein PYW08_006567 [Mythimna loreyi]